MKHLRSVALLACVLALPACKTMQGVMKDIDSISMPSLSNSTFSNTKELVYSGACPRAEAVEELQTLAEFTDVSNPAQSNMISKVEIANIKDSCSYDENTVTIDLKMDFLGTLGPQGRLGPSPSFSYPFFVAVTASNGNILAKEIFSAPLSYGPGQSTQAYTEKLRQIIPLENSNQGRNFKVLVGFQLTPDQLAYNRQKIAEAKLAAEAAKTQPKPFEAQAQNAQEQANKDIYIGRPVQITP